MTEQEIKKLSTPRRAWRWFEKQRWPDGPVCPHCNSKRVTRITPRKRSKSPARYRLHCCNDCFGQFTVTTGTVLEDSHVPLNKWLLAIIWMSSSEGLNAHQLHLMLGVRYDTTCRMGKRIRYAMELKS